MADDGKGSVMTMDDIKLEKLSVEKKEEYTDFLIEAYKDQFHSHMFRDREAVKKRWLWEYTEDPAPVEGKPLIWVIRIGGKMVGQMCVMPFELNIHGKYYKAGWCQDFIVLPEYRKQGIGRSIVQQVTEESKKYLDILFAVVASEASYKVFERASYIDMGFTNRSVKVLNSERLARKLTGNVILRLFYSAAINSLFGILGISRLLYSAGGITVDEAHRFDEALDGFYLSISKKISLIARRNKKTLAWRFLDQPCSRSYKIFVAKSSDNIKGYVVLREADISRGRLNGLKVGIISDIFFDPEEKKVGMALLDAAIGYFGKRADIMKFDFLNKGLANIAMAEGFLSIGSRNRCYVYPISEELKARGAGLFKKGCYLTYGDSDLDFFS